MKYATIIAVAASAMSSSIFMTMSFLSWNFHGMVMYGVGTIISGALLKALIDHWG
jgi:hypothetical protein